jgi:hypothetical protein
MASRRLLPYAVALATSLAAGTAHALPTAADRETARELMQQGRDLRDKNDLRGALQRFKAADDIMHVPTTGLEVARAQASLGQLVEARDTIAAIRLVPEKPSDPEPFKEARVKADELDASLDGRVPAVTIAVHGAAAGEAPALTIDGVPVPPAVVGLPRNVDPGHHVIVVKTASAEGKAEVDVREGQRKPVELTLAASAGGPPNAQTAGPSDASPGADSAGANSSTAEATPERTTTTSHSPDALTYAGGALAGAGLVAGAVTGILSWSKKSSLESACPGHVCPPSSYSSYDSANTLATVSTFAFVAAGVGACVAVVSLIVGHEEKSEPASTPPAARLRVSPWIGAGAAGVGGSF